MTEFTLEQALTMGARLAHEGNHRDAVGLYRAVLAHQPSNVEAMVRLGASLFELGPGRLHEAFYWFWLARESDPKNPQAVMNYGLTLSQLGHPDKGIADIRRAVALGDRLKLPTDIRAMQYNNLGNSLERLGCHAEALDALDKGIGLCPFDDFPHYNRGVVLLRLNRQREALTALYHSLALKRARREDTTSKLNECDAYYNISMAHLLLGELKEGFGYYDSRLATTDSQLLPYFGLPLEHRWKPGQSIEGKRLLIHGEQGLGDAIQNLRFLPWLRTLKPKEIIFIEHAAIKPLLYDEPNVTVLKTGESLVDRYDLWVGLMSLPLHYGIESEDQIPPPYEIKEDIDRNYHWLKDMPPGPRRVGICWAGNFRHKNDHHRSIPLEKVAALFTAPVQFVSVQQLRDEDRATFATLQERHGIVDASSDDFRDAAAVMKLLDLMISVDTSVAHLAGSVGVPTWILIPKFATDWRWQLERTDSPWYPSARLFRQPKIGDWASVIKQVRNELMSITPKESTMPPVVLPAQANPAAAAAMADHGAIARDAATAIQNSYNAQRMGPPSPMAPNPAAAAPVAPIPAAPVAPVLPAQANPAATAALARAPGFTR